MLKKLLTPVPWLAGFSPPRMPSGETDRAMPGGVLQGFRSSSSYPWESGSVIGDFSGHHLCNSDPPLRAVSPCRRAVPLVARHHAA